MNDLRKAAEMALEALEDIFGKEKKDVGAINALRQALDDKPAVKSYCGGAPNYCTPEETPEVTPEVPCKTHPDAPHGFDRNASHSADRYVCECESWEPVDAVNMSQERVDETDKFNHITVVCHKDHDKGYEDYVGKCLLCEVERLQNRDWVGLTDEEIQAERHKLDPTAGWTYDHFARAIEAKIKEKNT